MASYRKLLHEKFQTPMIHRIRTQSAQQYIKFLCPNPGSRSQEKLYSSKMLVSQ